jgi:PAS domain S-box-containing protein
MGLAEGKVAGDSDLAMRREAELAALFRLTDRLYRARGAADIYEASLAAITSTLGCKRASILLFDAAGVMKFVAQKGLSASYVAAVEGHSPWKLGQAHPDPIFVENIEDTDEPLHIKETIKKERICGLAFLPLISQGGVIGKFMTYYEQSHKFTPAEIELAVTIARQLGFAVERLRAEAARKKVAEELRESEERFRLMSENAPVMIWMSDPNGGCLHLNRMLREFWNVEEGAIAEFDWRSTMHPEDMPEIMKRVSEALASKSSVSVEGRYRNAQGIYRTLQTSARPRLSSDGELLGMIGVNVDITERKEAELMRRENDERFRLAVEAAPCGMLMLDEDGRIVMMNAKAERLFEYSKDELLGKKIEALIPAGAATGPPAGQSSGGPDSPAHPLGNGEVTSALTKNGKEIPIELGSNPIRIGGKAMAILALVDVSERKRADKQRELLLAELNHRVKNTLAVVLGLAHQTFRDKESAAKKAFEGRLIALATAHNLLTRANWESASLRDLVLDSLPVKQTGSTRFRIGGPLVLLAPQPALALTLALHELFTNALKYGALSNETGKIDVEWNRNEDDAAPLTLIWRESGGPAVSPPTRRGFGTMLLERTLAEDLNGKVDMEYRPEGLLCTIRSSILKNGAYA